MSIVTAKAFRQQIMKPAEGLFLFHARAIERLIEGQLGERLVGVTVPDLPYFLMPRADFLLGLETENAEALSVIEGLDLPPQVILLPSPPDQRLEQRSFDRLRYDYWARSFEAEVARTWQAARDCADEGALHDADSLRALIGQQAFAEVREVLGHDGLILPVWDDELISRTFVAFIVRLRYFAPGARGFCFPAIQVWPEVDRWMSSGGLDLPRPLVDTRLPRLLIKSRPGNGGTLRADPPLLPLALDYGRSDPDRARMAARLMPAGAHSGGPDAGGTAAARQSQRSSDLDVGVGLPGGSGGVEHGCLNAIERGSRLGQGASFLDRLGDQWGIWRTRLMGALRWVPPLLPSSLHGRVRRPAGAAGEAERRAGLVLLERAISSATRAQQGGYLTLALRRLGSARRLMRRLMPDRSALPAVLEEAIGRREVRVQSSLRDGVAECWSIDSDTQAELLELIRRLAADGRTGLGSPAAQGLLTCLEQLQLRGPHDFYRLRIGRWIRHFGLGGIRELLPFQPMLKALRALEASRSRLEELPWPITDLERFSSVLNALDRRITQRADTELTPWVEQAMREADFVPRNHRERVAEHKMKLELLDVIKHRRHLKFTDVRDIVARNILRLPDPTLDEFFRGDRLRRFDRTAARALPGVYRPGEMYIKGLQQLGAPLFGTSLGRDILSYLLLPFGGAYLVLKSLDVLLELMPFVEKGFHLTEPVSVLSCGVLINLVAYSGIGRHLAEVLAVGGWRLLRFLFWDGPRGLLRWWPIAGLLSTGLMRGLGRNLVQPLLIGALPLVPIITLAVLVDEVPIEPGLWLLGLAFALGTLARNTPAGRRFLDNLSTQIGAYLQRINQALFIGLIQQLMYFFKEVTRRFSQLLHRVDEALTHHLEESWTSLTLKALLAPVWRLFEASIQFYVTVLVEPQVNPVKHFPVVTVGHKLLLPFLPAITSAFIEVTESVLPKVIAYPFVTLTILLLPGFFGFLVWELKENWKLYEANHRQRLRASDDDDRPGAQTEPAMVGVHGESMRGLMYRGFHSGTLPKGFDRLRRVIREQLRDDSAYPTRVRRCQRQLGEVEHAIRVFVDREFSFALRDRCRNPHCTLSRVETNLPRLATQLVEISVAIHARAGVPNVLPRNREQVFANNDQSSAFEDPAVADETPVMLGIRITLNGRQMRFDTELSGTTERISQRCWAMISEDLRLFAGRAGADLRSLEVTLPDSATRVVDGGHSEADGRLPGRYQISG